MMMRKAIALCTALLILSICGVAIAQVTIAEFTRNTLCEILNDPYTYEGQSGPGVGPWSNETFIENIGTAQAIQISDLQFELDDSVAILTADLSAVVVRVEPAGVEALHAASSLNIQLTVSEASTVKLQGALGEGAGYFFGKVLGGFFHEWEGVGTADHTETLAAGETCFLNLWAGAWTPEEGVASSESDAGITLTIGPVGVIANDLSSWGQVKGLYR